MKQYLGVGIAVGVLAGIWTQVSLSLGLITWVAFIAWACFFAAGGGFEGFRKGLAANLSGVVWGWVVSILATTLTFSGSLAVLVAVIAFILCIQAGWAPLSFIPGAFAGTAVFFGTAFAFWQTVAALVIGAGLGWLSAVIAARIQAAIDRPDPRTAQEPAPPAQTV